MAVLPAIESAGPVPVPVIDAVERPVVERLGKLAAPLPVILPTLRSPFAVICVAPSVKDAVELGTDELMVPVVSDVFAVMTGAVTDPAVTAPEPAFTEAALTVPVLTVPE